MSRVGERGSEVLGWRQIVSLIRVVRVGLTEMVILSKILEI